MPCLRSENTERVTSLLIDLKKIVSSLYRPVGVLYAPYMAFSGSQGAVTSEQNVALLAVFSEAITGLSTSSFKASATASFYADLPCESLFQQNIVSCCRQISRKDADDRVMNGRSQVPALLQ